jgi:hypothetical protein
MTRVAPDPQGGRHQTAQVSVEASTANLLRLGVIPYDTKANNIGPLVPVDFWTEN